MGISTPCLESGRGDLLPSVLYRGLMHKAGLKHLAADKFEETVSLGILRYQQRKITEIVWNVPF